MTWRGSLIFLYWVPWRSWETVAVWAGGNTLDRSPDFSYCCVLSGELRQMCDAMNTQDAINLSCAESLSLFPFLQKAFPLSSDRADDFLMLVLRVLRSQFSHQAVQTKWTMTMFSGTCKGGTGVSSCPSTCIAPGSHRAVPTARQEQELTSNMVRSADRAFCWPRGRHQPARSTWNGFKTQQLQKVCTILPAPSS